MLPKEDNNYSIKELTMSFPEQPPLPPRYQSIDGPNVIFAPSNLPPQRTIVPVQNPGIPVDEESETDNFRCLPWCDDERVWRTFTSLALGQGVALSLSATAISSQILSKHDFNAPAAQNFLNYFLLAFVYGIVLVFRNGEHNFLNVLRKRGWKYFILAFVDVQANYIIVFAYQFTNITSIQLLDCSTIPTVMVLSFLFLSTRYLLIHVIGVAICMVGIAFVIWADIGDPGSGSNPLLGDLLCVASTFLYAISNISEEFLVKEHDRIEYLGFIGIFGSIISGLQFGILEHRHLATVTWNFPIIGGYLLFTFSMFAFYSMVSVVIRKTSALMFNLATLTSDFYSLIAGIIIFHLPFKFLYCVSFLFVIAGTVIYSLKKTQKGRHENRSLACRCFRAICPCFGCCKECRPTSPYTVQEVERSPSASLELQDTSCSYSD